MFLHYGVVVALAVKWWIKTRNVFYKEMLHELGDGLVKGARSMIEAECKWLVASHLAGSF